jgi:hypothetical protein
MVPLSREMKWFRIGFSFLWTSFIILYRTLSRLSFKRGTKSENCLDIASSMKSSDILRNLKRYELLKL